jgi:hypothetical protein
MKVEILTGKYLIGAKDEVQKLEEKPNSQPHYKNTNISKKNQKKRKWGRRILSISNEMERSRSV